MKLRLALVVLVVTYLAVCAVLGPTATPSQAAACHPFDPVFKIMNRLPEDKGCYGCHIGSEPTFGIWWGEDRDTVLWTLETGINPEGIELPHIPVEGGRMSILASRLYDGIMPLGGTPWEKKELYLLDKWLSIYE